MITGRALRFGVLAGLFALVGTLSNSFEAAAETPGRLIDQADALWSQGKLQGAQERFEAAVASAPNAVAARLRLAGFQLAQQQTSASIANYQQVISAEPTNSKAWIGLGLAYLHSGRREPARAALAEAIRVDPSRQEKIAPLIAKLDARQG